MGDVDERDRIERELTPWVRQHVAFPDRVHGRCHQVKLRHLNVNREIQGDVTALPVKLDEGGEEDGITPLLHQIAEAAQRDADDINQGVQTYAIYAYYTADKNYAVRKMFRVASTAEAEMDRNLNPSEPANEKGLVAQSMRHVEVLMRHMTVVTTMQFQSLTRENQRLSEMNERFSQQQIDFLTLYQDTMNQATTRRLQEKKEEASLAMKEEALAKLSALVPVVINRIAGQKVLPEEDQSFMLMASLLENMPEEQQLKFYNMLTESQKMTLAEILAQYEKKKSRWLQDKKSMIVGKRNELPSAASPTTASPAAADGEPASSPLPTEMPLTQRMLATTTEKSSDPVLRKIEEDGESLMSRFSDFLKPPPKGK
jgi:hypothetical protein